MPYRFSLLLSWIVFGNTRTGDVKLIGCCVTTKSVDFEPSSLDHLPSISASEESGPSFCGCHLPLKTPVCFPVSSASVSSRSHALLTVPVTAMFLPTRG